MNVSRNRKRPISNFQFASHSPVFPTRFSQQSVCKMHHKTREETFRFASQTGNNSGGEKFHYVEETNANGLTRSVCKILASIDLKHPQPPLRRKQPTHPKLAKSRSQPIRISANPSADSPAPRSLLALAKSDGRCGAMIAKVDPAWLPIDGDTDRHFRHSNGMSQHFDSHCLSCIVCHVGTSSFPPAMLDAKQAWNKVSRKPVDMLSTR